jgi:hypothetical protein
LKHINVELKHFEQQYKLNSAEFYAKFERGELGDNLDFIDWSGAWRIYKTIQASLAIIEVEASTS